jgi:hypothetical protein
MARSVIGPEGRRRGGNHDAVNTVRQKLNAFADALVKQVKSLPDPFVGTCKQVPTFVVQYSFGFSATRQQEKYHAIEVRNVQVHCP